MCSKIFIGLHYHIFPWQHFLDSGQTRIGMTKESEMVAETTNIAVVSSDSSMVVTLPVTTVTAATAAELLEGCVKMETLDETDIGKHAAISSGLYCVN